MKKPAATASCAVCKAENPHGFTFCFHCRTPPSAAAPPAREPAPPPVGPSVYDPAPSPTTTTHEVRKRFY